ncbi:MAG: ferrochelatase [Acidipila sp.]|nr:ferrochelatase [Acidipila sp.]
MPQEKKLGVVLFQLGGPDSLDAVAPFLYNLFCDPDIIPIPLGAVLRKPLARYISRKRAKVVSDHYRAIGGRSPLGLLTERQARALEASLRSGTANSGLDAFVTVAMRYWHPLTAEAVARVDAESPQELVLLPLYPHYSYATTLSSLKEWKRCSSNGHLPAGLRTRVVDNFHDHPLYIQSLVERIHLTFQQFDEPARVHILFSAHGLPMSLVEKGDPYPQQIEGTVKAVLQAGAWPNPHTLCYQSRVGPQKWLEPSLLSTIDLLGRKKVTDLLVIPLSFVTEHIETLYEINIETREAAAKVGITNFRMMPAVGDSPTFIACLDALVRTALNTDPSTS